MERSTADTHVEDLHKPKRGPDTPYVGPEIVNKLLL